MSFSTADLTAIESAIATGEMTVEVNGKRVTYRSVDDLLKARAAIQTALQSSGAIQTAARVSLVSRSRE